GDRAGLARTGVAVEARLPALPGRVLQGRIATVTPSVDAATQTAAALVPLGNPGGALLPGMFADVRVATGAAVRAVLVPRAAVIYDGARKLVMIARDTTFFPSAVVLGPVVGERVAVILRRIILFSLTHRFLILAAAAAAALGGAFALGRMPADVLPPLNAPVVLVVVENAGLAPQEMEALVARPLESAVRGLPGTRFVRTKSSQGLT